MHNRKYPPITRDDLGEMSAEEWKEWFKEGIEAISFGNKKDNGHSAFHPLWVSPDLVDLIPRNLAYEIRLSCHVNKPFHAICQLLKDWSVQGQRANSASLLVKLTVTLAEQAGHNQLYNEHRKLNPPFDIDLYNRFCSENKSELKASLENFFEKNEGLIGDNEADAFSSTFVLMDKEQVQILIRKLFTLNNLSAETKGKIVASFLSTFGVDDAVQKVNSLILDTKTPPSEFYQSIIDNISGGEFSFERQMASFQSDEEATEKQKGISKQLINALNNHIKDMGYPSTICQEVSVERANPEKKKGGI